MSLIFKEADWEKLCQQVSQSQLDNMVLDDFEKLWKSPGFGARGYCREVEELSPGVLLQFSDYEHDEDLVLQTPDHKHPFQITIFLSGYSNCDIHPTFSKTRSYFSGSGISPAYKNRYLTGQHEVAVNIEIEPEVLESHFTGDNQLSSSLQKQLFKGEDWKVSFYPTVTPAMLSLAHQLYNAPYRGAVKRMYLQAKVFELLALHLDLISANLEPTKSTSTIKLKPKTVDALYHAKDILSERFEHPPSLPQLVQQVGISERTLQKGFSLLFNTTVMGYLTQQRLDRAETLLREGKYSVADVATKVGYGNMGHFSVAFRGRFGITPSQCLAGKQVDADIEQTNDGF